MRNIVILIILILRVTSSVFGQDSREFSLIDEINAHFEGTAVWWAGHNSWLIKSNDLLISTDLFLTNENRYEPAPVTPEEIAGELDVSFVTHAHGDHFNRYTSRVLLEKSSCIFVMPESCLPVAEELNIPEERIVVARPRESFEVKGVKVEALRAIHGNASFAIYYEANLQDCGYLLTIDDKTFLQPDDSYLLEDHLFLEHMDVLFFSPTEHNMYIDRSVILINTLNPDYIFPQHHSTIDYDESSRFWGKGYPEEVRIRLSKPLQKRYYILKPGNKVIIK